MTRRTKGKGSPGPDKTHASPSGWQTGAERKAAQRRAERLRKRRWIRVGQVLMSIAGVMALTHLSMHLQLFGTQQPSSLLDLVAGYPMAGLLAIAGAILMGR